MDVWRRKSGEPFRRDESIAPITEEIRATTEQTDYRMRLWRANRDIIVGLHFVATMNPWVPLRVLSRHGELHTDINRAPPEIALNQSEGIWVQKMCSFRSLGIDIDDPPEGTMASSIGQIPTDGGDFLKFLIAIRRIVESDQTVDMRSAQLHQELSHPCWSKFAGEFPCSTRLLTGVYFPSAISTIPGLTMSILDAFELLGLDTAAKVAAATDSDLLQVKGIGPAKLKAIRDWQTRVADPNAVTLDCVAR